MRIWVVAACTLLAFACTPEGKTQPAASERDDDVAELRLLISVALEEAGNRMDDPVLRQVDISRATGGRSFRFTDPSAEKGLDLHYSGGKSGDQEPEVVHLEITPFEGHASPGLAYSALRVGPNEVASVVLSQWPDCRFPHLTLTGEGENLGWVAFCKTDAGLLSATVDNERGEFHSRGGGPAPIAPTAAPRSR